MTRRRWAPLAIVGAAAVAGSLVAGEAHLDGGRSRLLAREAPVTFSGDVAPLLYERCVSCHRPDGGAPFSLLTYRDARPRARSIVAATARHDMPPWKPEPGYGEFVGSGRLTEEQIALFQRWVEDGAVEGDPAELPPAPTFEGRWDLGTPDLVLETASYTLRAGGGDVYRNFVVPTRTTTKKYVRAWQFLPGNPRVVHHATMHVDPTGASRALDAKDPAPGYEGLIPHSAGRPDGFFLGWVPGYRPYIAPEGMAWLLQPNSDIVMMLHLRPSGTEEVVQASLGLYFSDTPPRLQPVLVRLTRQNMDIAPGDAHYVVTQSFTLQADVDVYTVQPHAHYLAREIKGFATLPDGRRKWLIYIKNWEFDWQGIFEFRKPEFLPAGTTIQMEYTYDNSAGNPNNPQKPPRRVTYGQQTSDEMADLWLQVVPRHPEDRVPLVRALRAQEVREEIVGIEMELKKDPGNIDLHNDVALYYAETGNLDGTAAHFAESARLAPDSAPAHYNLGTTRLMQRQWPEARTEFERALELTPDYALAHDGLGTVLQAEGRLREALPHFERALELAPNDLDTRHHLAFALASAGRLEEAASQYRRLLQQDPSRAAARAELQAVERQLPGAAER